MSEDSIQYDQGCVDKTIAAHAQKLERAERPQTMCITRVALAGTVVGAGVGMAVSAPTVAGISAGGPVGAAIGGTIGALAGPFICDHISGVNDLPESPNLSQCVVQNTPDGQIR